MASPTINQLYGGFNKRFERRAVILLKMGFRFQRHDVTADTVPGGSIGVFVRRNKVLAAAFVLYAPNAVWIDMISAYRHKSVI